jgi:hypothetical protein
MGHLLRGDPEPAREAFHTALRLGSQDFRVPFHLAQLAQTANAPGGPTSAQVLAWLETARGLRPDFPGIHMALCRQYSLEPRDPVRALQEGRQAVEAEPNQLGYRLNLGIACVNLDLEAEARAIGEQLQRLALSPAERQIAQSYAETLARYLAGKQAQSLAELPPGAATGPALRTRPVAPLKFSLPAHLAPLGQEVTGLVAQDRPGEAIARVEAVLAKAGNDYDRKALRGLLAALKGRAPGK